MLARHENVYEGPVLTITTEGGTIRTTVYHPFWVERGRDLAERSTPRELAADEDQGGALAGRWVNSHELRVGDVLVGADGSPQSILRIEQEFKSAFPVNNLTIDELRTFAVGHDGVLVHNTPGCELPNSGGRYPWSPTYSEVVADSHHIIQDAAAKSVPRAPGRPAYSRSRAPATQLDGPSTQVGSQHYYATRVQDQLGGGTYGAERRIGYKALRQGGKTVEAARAEIERADRYFIDELGWTKATPTRIPGNRR